MQESSCTAEVQSECTPNQNQTCPRKAGSFGQCQLSPRGKSTRAMEKSIAIFCLLSIASLKVKVLRRGGVVVSVPELRPRRMEEERPPAAGSGAGTGRVRRGGFVVWLHGLGDCGRANEFIADHFSAAALSDARWAFPTAPTAPVTCNRRCLPSRPFAPRCC
jgi:hypothetical protein